MRHKVVVNIPSRGLYPLRDLFIASDGKLVLGADGAGLELRMLAHFMADKVYQQIVLTGDIHTYNQTLAGLPERDMAKTFIYAFLYGSGIANLAAVCGLSVRDMEKRVAKFKRELPALSNLVARIQRAGEATGHLLAVDGRWGRIRARGGELLVHTMLNVLLQMTGSLSMKYGLVFAEDEMLKEGVGLDDAGFVTWLANVHDEVQMEVEEDEVLWKTYPCDDFKSEEKKQHLDSDGRLWSAPSFDKEAGTATRAYHRAGQILCEQMTRAGEHLKMRCPLAGEYKIGKSWAETH
jgi:DNA polymerase I-like protein with 3'-5' exonuclease and polymerase domains